MPKKRNPNKDPFHFFRKAVYRKAQNTCEVPSCNKSFYDGDRLEAHHITPRYAGGDNNPNNGKLLCIEHHEREHREVFEAGVLDGADPNQGFMAAEKWSFGKILDRIAKVGTKY